MPLVRQNCKTVCRDVVIPDSKGNPIGGMSCKKVCETLSAGRPSGGQTSTRPQRPSDVLQDIVSGYQRGTGQVMRVKVNADGTVVESFHEQNSKEARCFQMCMSKEE